MASRALRQNGRMSPHLSGPADRDTSDDDGAAPRACDGAAVREVPLPGGDVTVGVVRVGDTVRRPMGPPSPLVHEVLAHLERVAFAGAPRLLGVDDAGREALTFVEGEVAGRPWPAWVADTGRIASVARLVRSYDDAVGSLGLPATSAVALLPALPGMPASVAGPAELIGHLDVTPENVVFRAGVAFALIDFDLLRPAARVEEVANVLLWWAPLMPERDRDPALAGVDAIARSTLLVDAYGLGDADRGRLVAVAQNTCERSWYLMRDRADRLGGGWRRMWDEGVGDRILRRQSWLAAHAQALEAAVT